MNFIFIEGMRTDARIGIYSRERVVSQVVELDMNFGMPEAAGEHDNIEESIDYAEVISLIRTELSARHFNLVETLGRFVADLLCERFSADWAKVWVSKPGAQKGVRRVGAYVERRKPDVLPAAMSDGGAGG